MASPFKPERLVITSAFIAQSLTASLPQPSANPCFFPPCTGRYILLSLGDRPSGRAPCGRDGALAHSPNSCASRIGKADFRRGGGKRQRVHWPYIPVKGCIRGEVYRGYHFCTPSFCSRCSDYLLCYRSLWTDPQF